MKVDRMLRVNELIRRELGIVIERDLSSYLPALVTVTEVKTSPDLHEAQVGVSIMGSDEQRREALALLSRHRRAFQAHLAQHVRIKYTPVITFRLDLSLERADHVLALIEELGLEPDADDGSAAADGAAPPATEE
jgi:ribosome-binding factor A